VPVEQPGVKGFAMKSETRGSIGPKDPASGHLDVVNRIDVERLQKQSSRELLPFFVVQAASNPKPPPEVLPAPDISDEGPHLAYAGQWFIFATIGAAGWPLTVRKAMRDD
jgi:surfeit locus 1 family protein